MSNDKHTPDQENDLHNQKPRFIDPSAREQVELGYFLDEKEEPVEVELIGAPDEFKVEDYGLPRPIDLDQSVSASSVSAKPVGPAEKTGKNGEPEQKKPSEPSGAKTPAPKQGGKKQAEPSPAKADAKAGQGKSALNLESSQPKEGKQPKGRKEKKAQAKGNLSDTRKIEAIKQAQKKYQEEAKEASGEKGLPPEGKKGRKKKAKVHWVRSFVLVGIMLIISGALASLILFGLNDVYAVAKPDRVISVEIPQGAHAPEISSILGNKGVVNLPWMFQFVIKMREDGDQFQYGTYTLNSNMDYETIIETLKKSPADGEQEGTVRLTFPEGQTLDAFALQLEQKGVCSSKDFLDAINLKTYSLTMEEHLADVDSSLKYYRMEGYAFPDTYDFYKNENPESVARKFLANLDSKLTDPMYGLMDVQGLTLDQAITLASIVQAEAGTPEDMPKIASVLLNRYHSQGAYPKLQSDPTTKYANDLQAKLAEEGKPYEEIVKAYDTYQGDGIPPGAICNPGLDAINAVLNPENTNYYYFCANINTKECFYAETLEEHNKNLELAGLK